MQDTHSVHTSSTPLGTPLGLHLPHPLALQLLLDACQVGSILEAAVALVERERGDYDAEGEYSSFEVRVAHEQLQG